ncbi:MAG: alpha/beta hydrolase, partial [Pseudonocardia sp.]|nr:alpha/beta hydrolase [Pseudonocardia sp.]
TQRQVVRVGAGGATGNRPPLAIVGDSAAAPTAPVAAVLAGQVPLELLDRFDLVAIDRRGSGYDALDCAPATARAALVDADPAAIDQASLSRLLDHARELVQECAIDTNGNLAQFRSAATSFDLDVLRTALGVRRLSAIGIGDGANAVLGWARVNPDAAGRIVLDGPTQPGLDDPELTESRIRATEAAFDAFAAACAARPGCPLGADPLATVTALVETLRLRPQAAADGGRLTAGSALFALRTGLMEPRGWPGLAAALAAAGAGDPATLLAGLDRVLGPRGSFDAALATRCNDTRTRLAPAQAADFAGRMREAYPLFGAAMALQVVKCAAWPTARPAPGAPLAGLPPMLVIGTAADPRSTLEGARRLAQSLPGAVFVSWQGAGTGAFPRTACVTQAVTGMLVDGQLPPDGTLCPP